VTMGMIPGAMSLIFSRTSNPLRPGILRSMRARAGFSSLAFSRPTWPFSAVSALDPSLIRIREQESRMASSSSITRMVGFSAMVPSPAGILHENPGHFSGREDYQTGRHCFLPISRARGSPSESPPQQSGHGSSRLSERRAERGQGADFSRWEKFASFGGNSLELLFSQQIDRLVGLTQQGA